MVGVKLWIARRCNTAELDPIIERAAPIIGMPPIGPDHPARKMLILQIEKRPETRT